MKKHRSLILAALVAVALTFPSLAMAGNGITATEMQAMFDGKVEVAALTVGEMEATEGALLTLPLALVSPALGLTGPVLGVAEPLLGGLLGGGLPVVDGLLGGGLPVVDGLLGGGLL
ncbi:hypothetical protein [Desulfurivibrio alkaliphilus]|uniref:Uncharacterized protein n=1 Tax=Desulfurivibrio alkaliphilus (strain DSM 19089 / UNIQEM U267 / AHT2) TaxID=589865 RepID=D6Z1R4_DESAT|nr:hypothetical protein [Desulfurivibrio alkaliphilus]ADH85489.1 hypothetical protein DaAHT2_0785 [Desulfurivibrio alkaliphilus AHT 2]